MSLVLYPDSDDDDPDNSLALPAHDAPKIAAEAEVHDAALPPLPAAFHDLYSSNARVSTMDSPSLHGGRKRTVPHVEGNWPSHVYLEWVPSHAESEALHRLISSIQESIVEANKARQKPLPVPDITPSLRSPLGAPLPLHISLSRTLQVKTDDRGHFIETLTASVRKAAIRPFTLQFATLKWVSNFQRNRWFLVIGIAKPAQDELNRLLKACNHAAEKCGHPGLYVGGIGDGPMAGNEYQKHTGNEYQENATKRRKTTHPDGDNMKATDESVDRTTNFHISIAWNLSNPDPEWIALLDKFQVDKYFQAPETSFNAVKAKVGNAVHNIELGMRQGGTRKGAGILGLG